MNLSLLWIFLEFKIILKNYWIVNAIKVFIDKFRLAKLLNKFMLFSMKVAALPKR